MKYLLPTDTTNISDFDPLFLVFFYKQVFYHPLLKDLGYFMKFHIYIAFLPRASTIEIIYYPVSEEVDVARQS